MGCKHPENSRSHKFCVGCIDKYMCEDSTYEIPVMPFVSPPKIDETNIVKAIKLLIDNGYSVVKLKQ